MKATLKHLVDTALAVRVYHTRCQELSEALRQEASWINQEAIAHQLGNCLEQWRKSLNEYWRLSAECERSCPDEEVFTIHNLDEMVSNYNQAR